METLSSELIKDGGISDGSDNSVVNKEVDFVSLPVNSVNVPTGTKSGGDTFGMHGVFVVNDVSDSSLGTKGGNEIDGEVLVTVEGGESLGGNRAGHIGTVHGARVGHGVGKGLVLGDSGSGELVVSDVGVEDVVLLYYGFLFFSLTLGVDVKNDLNTTGDLAGVNVSNDVEGAICEGLNVGIDAVRGGKLGECLHCFGLIRLFYYKIVKIFQFIA